VSHKHLDRAEVFNLVYTGQADAMVVAYARLLTDFTQMTAWGRGLEHDKRLLEEENARLKAEVELWKLRSDNWQKFCELTRPEMTDELTRLKAEVERLTELNSTLALRYDATKSMLDGCAKEIEEMEAEVERLTSDIQMEKENEDRLVREWQKANNEVYGLQRQVAALIDDQTRLKAECQARQAENSVLAVECDSLKAEVERLKRLIPSEDDINRGGFNP